MRKSRQERKMYGHGGGSKRQMYNQGSLATHKSIGDLDLSLSARGNQNYMSTTSTASYNKGSFTMTHQSTTDRFKDKYNSGKVNYNNSNLGIDTKAGRFGVDKRGNMSYSTTTKGGTTISARANNKGGSLSIFKEL